MRKRVLTITGIRPDFIRMSEIFRKLDSEFDHVLVHTGQHFDDNLSGTFFKQLKIRMPDYNWGIGEKGGDHIEQLGHLCYRIKEYEALVRSADLVLFLGDSNSVLASVPVKKMGVKIGHIEAGMRSGDDRMLEETNRRTCDHCSDLKFCYHMNYAGNLWSEGVKKGIEVVGNTIVEVVDKHRGLIKQSGNHAILDVHRPENFLYHDRLRNILDMTETLARSAACDVLMLRFPRTLVEIEKAGIDMSRYPHIKHTDLMGYIEYLSAVKSSKFIVSDSGTAQEEPALLGIKVIVPRDFTERPESVKFGCSKMVDVNSPLDPSTGFELLDWIFDDTTVINTSWLGDGNTSEKVVDGIRSFICD